MSITVQNVLIFYLVKVAMLGQFKKDYVALNLPSVGADANGIRGWPKKSLWRVRSVLRKCYLIKGMFFLIFITIMSGPAGGCCQFFTRLTQIFAVIADHMKPEGMCCGGFLSHNICASLHKNRLPGLKVEMDMHTQLCDLINIIP